MKKFLLPLLALGVLVAAAPHKAEAHSRFLFNFGFGVPVYAAPAYYAPPPVYYQPPPQVVYYAPPPQVVYERPVQYYGPPPGYHYEVRHEWRRPAYNNYYDRW